MLSTVTIQLPDMSGIQMAESSLITEWSAIRMGSEKQTKNPLFEWLQHKHATKNMQAHVLNNGLLVVFYSNGSIIWMSVNQMVTVYRCVWYSDPVHITCCSFIL